MECIEQQKPRDFSYCPYCGKQEIWGVKISCADLVPMQIIYRCNDCGAKFQVRLPKDIEGADKLHFTDELRSFAYGKGK